MKRIQSLRPGCLRRFIENQNQCLQSCFSDMIYDVSSPRFQSFLVTAMQTEWDFYNWDETKVNE